MRGLRNMLPIWSILVPMPWLTSPPHLFSRKLITANPTICAQHPASAAPPASPVSPSPAQIAAELIGRVSAIPTIVDTRIPIRKGCCCVAQMMSFPSRLAARPMGSAMSAATSVPERRVTRGVTSMSMRVSRLTILPNSAAMMATI